MCIATQEQHDDNYLSLAKQLIPAVVSAGGLIMEIHKRGVNAITKSDGSPVSEADRAAEAILLREISSILPSTKIVSEENSNSHKYEVEENFFLVDPLDGTKEFLKSDNSGAFTVNIGLINKQIPVMGIVYAPAMDRLFFGARGGGAFEVRGRYTTKIKARTRPKNGSVAVASVSHRDAKTDLWLDVNGINQIISIGSSLKFCLIAVGEADVYPRYGPTMEWDTAAGDAILRAAGGRVEDEEGKPLRYGKPNYRNTEFFAFGAI